MRSCGPKARGNWPGREYMPDMAHSQAYEYYSPGPGHRNVLAMSDNPGGEKENWLFADGLSARLPVKGTIPRGYMPYTYSNDSMGYERAGRELVNPFGRGDEKILAEGKEIYLISCAPCHGEKGMGNGKISASNDGPLGSIPNYFNDTYYLMSEGKMFHSVHHGKNLMGSYAQQLTAEQRWKTIAYVKKMQADKIAADKKIDSNAAYAYVRGSADRRVAGSSGLSTHIATSSEAVQSGTTRISGGDRSIMMGHTTTTVSGTTPSGVKIKEGNFLEDTSLDGKKKKPNLIQKVVKTVKDHREEKKAEKGKK